MSKRIVRMMIAIISLGACDIRASEKETIVFGITPWDTKEKLTKMYEPLMREVETKLGVATRFVVTQNYEGLTEMVLEERIDIGFFSPKSYVEAKRKIPGLRYMVTSMTTTKKGKVVDFYRGVIVSLKASKLRSLGDLKGKKFAFTNKESSSGFAYPAKLLEKKGYDYEKHFGKVYWLQKHERVMGALQKGSVDAAATWDGSLDNAIETYGPIFHILAETDPIPNDPFAAGPHVKAQLVDRLKQLFLGLKPDSKVIKAMRKAGYPDIGYSERNDAFYDIVRELP